MRKSGWGRTLPRLCGFRTKAVSCDGRKRDLPLDLQPFLAIIEESASWVTENFSVGPQMDHGDKRSP